jgi:hypothetical protein
MGQWLFSQSRFAGRFFMDGRISTDGIFGSLNVDFLGDTKGSSSSAEFNGSLERCSSKKKKAGKNEPHGNFLIN